MSARQHIQFPTAATTIGDFSRSRPWDFISCSCSWGLVLQSGFQAGVARFFSSCSTIRCDNLNVCSS